MDCHHLQIGLWNHLALRKIHNVTCACASAFLAASSGCLCLKTNLRSFSEMFLLRYVCYLCIKHAATTWGASQIFSMKIKVWITQRNVFFFPPYPRFLFPRYTVYPLTVYSRWKITRVIAPYVFSMETFSPSRISCYGFMSAGIKRREVLHYCCGRITSQLFSTS